jgi:hypothetical protein
MVTTSARKEHWNNYLLGANNMKSMKAIIAIAAVISLSACAVQAPRPIVDMQGVSPEVYARDYQDCQAYAAQGGDEGQSALNSGIAGGIAGAATGAIFGNRHDAGKLGLFTMLLSAGEGAAKAAQHKRQILFRCLEGRGYRTLG